MLAPRAIATIHTRVSIVRLLRLPRLRPRRPIAASASFEHENGLRSAIFLR